MTPENVCQRAPRMSAGGWPRRVSPPKQPRRIVINVEVSYKRRWLYAAWLFASLKMPKSALTCVKRGVTVKPVPPKESK